MIYKILNNTGNKKLNDLNDDELKYENEIILNELIKPNQMSFVLKDLNTHSNIYLIELFAISQFTFDKQLVSLPAKLIINNNNNLVSLSSSDDDYYKDDDVDDGYGDDQNSIPHSTATSTTTRLDILSIITIRNLTLQNVYFQNGLVKARLNWQLSQQLFTADFQLTWFPIKCLDSNGSLVKESLLPAPISSQTQKLQFEIYELKFSCDYVVNVKLLSSRYQTKRLIFSTIQFKVPECNEVIIIGKIKPLCYDYDMPAVLQITTAATTSTSGQISSKTAFNQQLENNVLSRFEFLSKNDVVTSTTPSLQSIKFVSIKSASILNNKTRNNHHRLKQVKFSNDNNYTLLSPSSSLLNYYYYTSKTSKKDENSVNSKTSLILATRSSSILLLFIIFSLSFLLLL